jgi:lysyl-tRNA synthetase, class II
MQAARGESAAPEEGGGAAAAAKLEAEAEMDPTAFYDNRVSFVAAQKEQGINPYPHKFHVDHSIPEYIEKFGSQVVPGEQMEVSVAIAGRIRTKRPSSSKLVFYDLVGGGEKVQIMASQNVSEHADDLDAFSKLHNSVKRGDIVGVVGRPGASKNGELSIFPTTMQARGHIKSLLYTGLDCCTATVPCLCVSPESWESLWEPS